MSDDVKELVVRLPADMHAAVAARAKEEERTISATIRLALRLYLRTPLPDWMVDK